MKSVEKVAVSIPTSTLKAVERARARLRKTRSAVVAEALEQWLAGEAPGEDDDRYVAGYLRHPERVDEASATAGAVVQGWEPWE
jgi:metal-responsive CopG/Arc/MetJ family transcriptional regulator